MTNMLSIMSTTYIAMHVIVFFILVVTVMTRSACVINPPNRSRVFVAGEKPKEEEG